MEDTLRAKVHNLDKNTGRLRQIHRQRHHMTLSNIVFFKERNPCQSGKAIFLNFLEVSTINFWRVSRQNPHEKPKQDSAHTAAPNHCWLLLTSSRPVAPTWFDDTKRSLLCRTAIWESVSSQTEKCRIWQKIPNFILKPRNEIEAFTLSLNDLRPGLLRQWYCQTVERVWMLVVPISELRCLRVSLHWLEIFHSGLGGS